MFHSLQGLVTGLTAESVYLSTGGVEWEIHVPTSVLQGSLRVGVEARLYVWLDLAEDQVRLFGFLTPQEKQAFLELLKVDGVGPRGALKILSSLSPVELAQALERGDPETLRKAPGIGLKTAQKIILTLRGKLVLDEAPRGGILYADVVQALVEMGHDRKLAQEAVQRAVAAVSNEGPGDPRQVEQNVFHQALLWLSNR